MIFFLAQKIFGRPSREKNRGMHAVVIAGISLSIAALLVMLAVLRGFETEYQKSLLDFNAHVVIPPQEGLEISEEKIRAALPPQVLKKIEPFLYREALLIHDGKIRGVILKGLGGSFTSFRMTSLGLVLGKALEEKLGGNIQQVKLMIPKSAQLTSKDILKLPVAGTFQTGLYEFDSQFALISLAELQKLFGLSENIYGFEIQLTDAGQAPAIAKKLEENLGPAVLVQHWVELNRPLFEAIRLEKWAFRILLGLMIFVAALNLIAAVLLAIFRKKRMIAILQSLGASPRQILKLFFLHGLRLGVAAVLAGMILGLCVIFLLQTAAKISIDAEVYFLKTLPAALDWGNFFIVAAFGLFLVCILSFIAAGGALRWNLREGLHGPR